jgi:nicotinamidase/pyrazinamidase
MTAFGPGDALLVVDMQHDFLPGGSLAVPDGDAIVPVLDEYVRVATARGIPVFATRDWHPPHHCSFHERGGPWPPHCIQGTWGAAFTEGIRFPDSTVVISKATNPDREAYSTFDGTPLDAELRARGVRRVVIGGIATEYCVRFSVRDAIAKGYGARVLTDAIRAIDPGEGARAEAEMLHLGAESYSEPNRRVSSRKSVA